MWSSFLSSSRNDFDDVQRQRGQQVGALRASTPATVDVPPDPQTAVVSSAANGDANADELTSLRQQYDDLAAEHEDLLILLAATCSERDQIHEQASRLQEQLTTLFNQTMHSGMPIAAGSSFVGQERQMHSRSDNVSPTAAIPTGGVDFAQNGAIPLSSGVEEANSGSLDAYFGSDSSDPFHAAGGVNLA